MYTNDILTCIVKGIYSLFVWSFASHSRIFHVFEDVTIAGEWLQIWTYARHS